MAIQRSYTTGTITSLTNGTGRILPDGAEQSIGFHVAACKNFEPTIGARVQFLHTSTVEAVYPEGFAHGSASMGRIKRNVVRG